jgi:transposase
VEREVRTFPTTTSGLLALSEWLSSRGATHIAMEATGVYWRPVWNILSDGEFELILANAKHVRNVPGRKTDVNDATWLADLLAHGLIRASFVPDTATQEQRGLLRTRKQLSRERTSHVQRLQRTLEEANIKLDSAISDVIGTSGRAMIEAMIAGETDPAKLASLAHPRIKAAPAKLAEALRGRVTKHHRFLLRLHLKQIDALDNAIADSKRRSTRMRKGAPWLKTVLIQCAWAATRRKASYLHAQFHRLRARRGAKKAIGAVAASILTAAYHMLKTGTLYQDLGPDHFHRRSKPSQVQRLVQKLSNFGYEVTVKPLAEAPRG